MLQAVLQKVYCPGRTEIQIDMLEYFYWYNDCPISPSCYLFVIVFFASDWIIICYMTIFVEIQVEKLKRLPKYS